VLFIVQALGLVRCVKSKFRARARKVRPQRKFRYLKTGCADCVPFYCCRDYILYPEIINTFTDPPTAILCSGTSWVVCERAGDGQTAKVCVRA